MPIFEAGFVPNDEPHRKKDPFFLNFRNFLSKFLYTERISVFHRTMEVKKTRKIRGFLSIELMLVLTVMAIFGGISLYVGKRIIDRAKMVAMDVEAQMFITALLEYYGMTGKWPVGTEVWISVRSFDNFLRRKFDEVLLDNPYSLSKKHPKELPNMWIYIDISVVNNRSAEDVLGELRQRTQRMVSKREVRSFESVRYFFPKEGDRAWIFSIPKVVSGRKLEVRHP